MLSHLAGRSRSEPGALLFGYAGWPTSLRDFFLFFNVGAGKSNSDPHTCATRTSPTEASSSPQVPLLKPEL